MVIFRGGYCYCYVFVYTLYTRDVYVYYMNNSVVYYSVCPEVIHSVCEPGLSSHRSILIHGLVIRVHADVLHTLSSLSEHRNTIVSQVCNGGWGMGCSSWYITPHMMIYHYII